MWFVGRAEGFRGLVGVPRVAWVGWYGACSGRDAMAFQFLGCARSWWWLSAVLLVGALFAVGCGGKAIEVVPDESGGASGGSAAASGGGPSRGGRTGTGGFQATAGVGVGGTYGSAGTTNTGGTTSGGAWSTGGTSGDFDDWNEPELLEWYRQGIVGTWSGVVTNPWTPAYEVQIEFKADGTYAAYSTAQTPVFYYGKDGESADRKYDLDDVKASRKATGFLVVEFAPGNTQHGTLDQVWLSTDQNTLTFDFWATWGDGRYGPISYKLSRI